MQEIVGFAISNPVQAATPSGGRSSSPASRRLRRRIQSVIGFIVAHFVHSRQKASAKWRGSMLLVPWVIPPAMSTLGGCGLFDPSYSAFKYTLSLFGIGPPIRGPGRCGRRVSGDNESPYSGTARRVVIHVLAFPLIAEVGAEQIYEQPPSTGAQTGGSGSGT